MAFAGAVPRSQHNSLFKAKPCHDGGTPCRLQTKLYHDASTVSGNKKPPPYGEFFISVKWGGLGPAVYTKSPGGGSFPFEPLKIASPALARFYCADYHRRFFPRDRAAIRSDDKVTRGSRAVAFFQAGIFISGLSQSPEKGPRQSGPVHLPPPMSRTGVGGHYGSESRRC